MSAGAIHLAAGVQTAALEPNATIRHAERLDLPGVRGATTGEFGRMVASAIGRVNEQLLVSQGDLQQLAAGNVRNLHQIMIRLEESRLSFQLRTRGSSPSFGPTPRRTRSTSCWWTSAATTWAGSPRWGRSG